MPVFHFNLADHIREIDIDGTELASEAAARIEAIVFAGAYLRDNPDLINQGEDFRVEVTDDSDRLLFAVKIMLIEDGDAKDI